jgi:mRNA-degrading endonuclease RelE of RelBE toxin-antitoxin system
MKFIIADTFMKSLGRLEREEQSQIKQAAFEFQAAPDNPGASFHKLERARDARFWSFRVSRDLRIIVHRDGASSLMLCYAGHHDDAYQWAERRSLDVHPSTGAAQFVEVKERVEEVVRQVVRDEEPPLFRKYEKDYLLGLGVPPQWVDALRTVGESAFLDVVGELPEEAAERLLDLAAGKAVPTPIPPRDVAPVEHPDAQRRFHTVTTHGELQAALDAPWDRWRVFLHPDQRELVERAMSGPARVTGGAGTGKTVVALHRAAFLARRFPKHQVLLTTFSKALAVRLEHSLELLLAGDAARERISVQHLHAVATRLTLGSGTDFVPATADQIAECVEVALKGRENEWLDSHFARSEWEHVVDAHGITRWEDYKAVSRKGRGLPLSAKKRAATWAVMEAIHAELQRRQLGTFNLLCASAAEQAARQPPYQHVIVDECQDFGPAELRLLRAACEPGDDDLFFCGDEGQRIYKPQVSWLSLGIDVRGRSKRLELNYRTTEQIRRRADALLPASVTDGDGQNEDHRTKSVLSGPPPEIQGYRTPAAEQEALAAWLRAQRDAGMALHEIGIFARTSKLISERVTPALRAADLPSQDIKSDRVPEAGRIAVGTMHGAKGLEFRAVAIVGCDRNQVPLRSVASRIRDGADREEFVEQERHLLYVACTRARERLRVTWSGEGCEWLTLTQLMQSP